MAAVKKCLFWTHVLSEFEQCDCETWHRWKSLQEDQLPSETQAQQKSGGTSRGATNQSCSGCPPEMTPRTHTRKHTVLCLHSLALKKQKDGCIRVGTEISLCDSSLRVFHNGNF